LYRQAYPFLYPRLSEFPAGFALVKLLLAMAAVGIPTFCMGGTLPALGEAIAAPGRRLGIPVGGLYAINLLGAALGTLTVPFVLLPRLGLDTSYACAVAGSLGVGLTAYVIGSKAPRRPSPEGPPPSRGDTSHPPSVAGVVLVLAGVSGLCTLALQVLWTRMFALVHENSLYSFAVVVFVFLLGLAGGAAIARRALGQGHGPRRLLSRAWCVAGLLVVVSPPLFHGLTDGFAYVSAGSWHSTLGRLLMLALVTMLPASLGLGMALPLVMEMAIPSGRQSAGPLIGRVLAVNTLGAIVGPLLATFLMGPALGLWWSLVVLGSFLVVAAAGAGLTRVEAAVGGSALLAALLLLEPAGLPPVLVRAAAGQRLISVREGTHGTTAVLADDRDRWITVNNSYVLGGTAAGEEERFQAHLPLLLHPSPHRVAFVGTGTGITAGAALLHPVDHIVALEIVPEVAIAAREDFADVNDGVMDDPRVSVVIDDGRNYLASAPQAFDVIVGDLLVPWRPAEAPLYTLEHFQSVRRALGADGIFCQWLPLYQLSPEQLAIILRTFLDVFPAASLWRGNFIPDEATLALVGHLGSRPLEPEAIDARLRALAASTDSSPFLEHPAGMWLFLVGPVTADTPWFAGARRNRDGRPWIELLSPRSHAGRDQGPPGQGHLMTPFLEEVAEGALEGTPLRTLDEEHQEWRATGAALSRASRTRGADGEERVLAILRTLPPELRRSLDVDR
ncbi:MAG TPA: fused MFS/spermidine synthase, partial [Vicinamibacteria bacterium]|nr:fused MFS/spermidine synthase [Vicinamibacteria bacterium]